MEVTYLVHATEDQDKIQNAIGRILGVTPMPEVESLEGHFGNKILRGRFHVTGDSAWNAFRLLTSKMGPELVTEVAENAAQYLDEHSSLFLRFDKQALVSGSFVLGPHDPVRFKIKPRAYLTKGAGPSYFRKLLEGA